MSSSQPRSFTAHSCRGALSLCLSLALFTLIDSAHAAPWKQIMNKSGIRVSTREEPGRNLPSFKGTGIVDADMYLILAVLRDGGRRRQWMSKSGVTRVLKRVSVFEAISYQQTLAPPLVSDREVVMRTRVYLNESKNELIATFDGEKWTSPIAGIDRDDFVLMPHLKGYWRLTSKGEGKTEVTYMVNTEPGGMIPDWLASRVTRSIPYWTLVGLRKQVKRNPGVYDDFLNSYDPKRAQGGVKATPPAPTAEVMRRLR